ncbi:nucleotidyltransferase domain-containing protein [Gillisia sp. JM1]|jgi:predicted nucleotidyltransferase|uniref:nucleotidyltransferase domain-containing protein n=1 Tax=Gillisia sp. JM1 TaxID=1283286 RepID=UPI0003FE3C0D|nr:nucleotidyltransferase domain-containing protein [Gillisia sp. JM1]
MKFGLNDALVQKIHDVFESFPEIREAIIYGSRAIGNYREGSDIDITFKGELSFDYLLQIEKELDDLMLPYTFDLSTYDKLSNEELLEHIDKKGKCFYNRNTV